MRMPAPSPFFATRRIWCELFFDKLLGRIPQIGQEVGFTQLAIQFTTQKKRNIELIFEKRANF